MAHPFYYPKGIHTRRHKPPKFDDYRTYKDYLRDEFVFRCVYCLVREKWLGSANFFSVEHYIPKSRDRDGLTHYPNLLYACMDCNRAKGNRVIPAKMHPEENPYGLHLVIRRDGKIEDLTPEGYFLIGRLNLNARLRIDYRRMHFDLLEDALARLEEPVARQRLIDFFGYPLDMPSLGRRSGANNPYSQRTDLDDWY